MTAIDRSNLFLFRSRRGLRDFVLLPMVLTAAGTVTYVVLAEVLIIGFDFAFSAAVAMTTGVMAVVALLVAILLYYPDWRALRASVWPLDTTAQVYERSLDRSRALTETIASLTRQRTETERLIVQLTRIEKAAMRSPRSDIPLKVRSLRKKLYENRDDIVREIRGAQETHQKLARHEQAYLAGQYKASDYDDITSMGLTIRHIRSRAATLNSRVSSAAQEQLVISRQLQPA